MAYLSTCGSNAQSSGVEPPSLEKVATTLGLVIVNAWNYRLPHDACQLSNGLLRPQPPVLRACVEIMVVSTLEKGKGDRHMPVPFSAPLFCPLRVVRMTGCGGSTSEVPSNFGSLGRLSTRRTQGVSKQFAALKGVSDFEGFHLLDPTYLLNRFQLMHKQSRCGAQMLLTTVTAKTGRKALENTENGPKAVNLRVKSACSEWFFASKGPLLQREARLGGPVLYTLY